MGGAELSLVCSVAESSPGSLCHDGKRGRRGLFGLYSIYYFVWVIRGKKINPLHNPAAYLASFTMFFFASLGMTKPDFHVSTCLYPPPANQCTLATPHRISQIPSLTLLGPGSGPCRLPAGTCGSMPDGCGRLWCGSTPLVYGMGEREGSPQQSDREKRGQRTRTPFTILEWLSIRRSSPSVQPV